MLHQYNSLRVNLTIKDLAQDLLAGTTTSKIHYIQHEVTSKMSYKQKTTADKVVKAHSFVSAQSHDSSMLSLAAGHSGLESGCAIYKPDSLGRFHYISWSLGFRTMRLELQHTPCKPDIKINFIIDVKHLPLHLAHYLK